MSEEAPRYDDLPDGRGLRVGIAVGRFNESITKNLLRGAEEALAACGVAADDIQVVWVPGAFELPLVAMRMAESHRVDAVVCLGAVVRGGTPHFEFVSAQAAAGISRVSLDTGLPAIFGVLTTDTMEQAVERSGNGPTNKGYEAVLAAIETVRVLREVEGC